MATIVAAVLPHPAVLVSYCHCLLPLLSIFRMTAVAGEEPKSTSSRRRERAGKASACRHNDIYVYLCWPVLINTALLHSVIELRHLLPASWKAHARHSWAANNSLALGNRVEDGCLQSQNRCQQNITDEDVTLSWLRSWLLLNFRSWLRVLFLHFWIMPGMTPGACNSQTTCQQKNGDKVISVVVTMAFMPGCPARIRLLLTQQSCTLQSVQTPAACK